MDAIKLVGLNGYAGSGKNTVASILQYLTAKEPFKVSLEEYLTGSWLHTSENNTWQVKSFAYKLKQIASILTGIPVGDLEKEEVKQSVLPECWDYWLYDGQVVNEEDLLKECIQEGFKITKEQVEGFRRRRTYREVLQVLGTELLRNQLHPDVWVNSLFSEYRVLYVNNRWYDNKDIFNVSEQDELLHPPEYPNWVISDLRFPNEYHAIKDRKGICVRINRGNPVNTHISETALDNYDFDWLIENTKDISYLVDQVKTMLTYYKIP